jgi:hypothetical protein
MDAGKLTPGLAARIESASASEYVDLILELCSQPAPPQMASFGSRGEKIAAQKEAFSRNAAPVESLVLQLGGEITGRAWINRTMRARVPIQSVGRLSEIDNVAALDLPRSIEPDAV